VEELRPNEAEKEFLSLAYARFYDIFDEVISDDFWEKDSQYRFSKIKDSFSVYSELLNYTPIQWTIEDLRSSRPPMEAEIGSELFKFIRNVITHFPFFERWGDTWINKKLINWHKENQSIDRFLEKYKGHQTIKYRFWEADKKRMTYLDINFPEKYTEDQKIYLKDMLSEKDGVRFSVILMKKILDTQIDKSSQHFTGLK